MEISEEDKALARLLDALFEGCGYDFRDYAYTSLKRRAGHFYRAEGLNSIDHLRDEILRDDALRQRLVRSLTVHVTSMFRDAAFYRTVREQVIPIWRTYPFVRLWVAGCSSGEEVYSLAILLLEEGLYGRCRIYATDVSEPILVRAREGIFPLSSMQDYTRAYQAAGGRSDFSDYYTAGDNAAMLRPFLRANIVFAPHNLASDASFNEFQGVFCRNVMIYFNRKLQLRTHRLLHESLAMFGYLGLGRSESIRHSGYDYAYETVHHHEKIYRKIA